MFPATPALLRLALVVLFSGVGLARALAQSITLTPSATAYSTAGGTVTFSVQIQFTQSLSALGLQVAAPAGWAFGEVGGTNRPQIAPPRGSTGSFDFAFTNVPSSPTTFTFTASHGAGLSGNQIFGGIRAIVRTTTNQTFEPTAPAIVLTPAGGGTDPSPVAAPTILVQPQGVSLSEGELLSVLVIASGTGPIAYQWHKDGGVIPGATSATYSIERVTAAAAGIYTVTASNSVGSVTSMGAAVAVRAAIAGPTIVSQPQGVAAPVGTPATLAVVALGTGPLTYQWRRNGNALTGATGATLRLAGTATESGSYTVVVGNSAGSATSAVANVLFTTQLSGISISQQPSAVAAQPGERVTLSVTASAPTGITYQWFKDGVVLAGQTSGLLILANVSAADAAEYVVELATGSERVRSSPASVTVGGRSAAPAIVRQPTALVVAPGGSPAFAVVASGIPEPAYQWRKNGTALAGATDARLSLANVQANDAGGYDVVVTNALGMRTSSLAQLTVQSSAAAPLILRHPASATGLVGQTIALTVVATGVPAPAYQWFKDGGAVPGATSSTLSLASLAGSAAGVYTVTASNSAGAVVSRAAVVRVLARSFAGTYFGALSGGGNFALHVRNDNTGAFLAYAPNTRVGYVGTDVTIGDSGAFRFGLSSSGPAPVRAAALAPGAPGDTERAAADDLILEGTIATNGTLSGNTTGVAAFAATGSRAANGGTSSFSGYYQAGAAGGAALLQGIVGPAGEAFVLTRVAGITDGGLGTVDGNGRVAVATTTAQTILLHLTSDTGAISGTATALGGTTTAFSGHVGSPGTELEFAL